MGKYQSSVRLIFGVWIAVARAEDGCCSLPGDLYYKKGDACATKTQLHGHPIVDVVSSAVGNLVRIDINGAKPNADRVREDFTTAVFELQKLDAMHYFPPGSNGTPSVIKPADREAFNLYNVLVSKHGSSNATPYLPVIASPSASTGSMIPPICSSPKIAPNIWNDCRHYESATDYEVPLFLLWHRAFVRSFEVTANSVVSRVRQQQKRTHVPFGVPYWNWLESPELPFVLRERPAGHPYANCQPNHQAKGNFLNERSALNHPDRDDMVKRGCPVWTRLQGVDPLRLPEGGRPVDFVEFTYNLQSLWHDQVHKGIGPHMGRVDTAVSDPAFWLLHSYVDKLLVEWLSKAISISTPGSASLSEAIIKDHELRQRWERESFLFPVLCGETFVWYRPRYEDIAPLIFDGQYVGRNSKPTVNTSGYRYDKVQPPIEEVHDKIDYSDLVNAALYDNNYIRTDRYSTVAEKSGPNAIEVRRLDKKKFTVGPEAVLINVAIGDGKLVNDILLRVRAAVKQDSEFLNKSILFELTGAQLKEFPARDEVFGIFARVNRDAPSGVGRSPRWRFLTFFSTFSVGVSEHGNLPVGNHQHSSQLFDISDELLDWARDSTSVSFKRADRVIQIAVVPLKVAQDQKTNRGVLRFGESSSTLEFDAARVLLRDVGGATVQ